MKWYWIGWSIFMLLCMLTQISILNDIREHMRVVRLLTGGWASRPDPWGEDEQAA